MTKAGATAAHEGAMPSGWLRRPLCRRYILGIFDVAIVRWHDAGGLNDHSVHWAFGWLVDGECEPLGAWTEPENGSDISLRIPADLRSRGVERIWHVTGTDTAAVRERVTDAFSSTTVFSSVDRIPAETPVWPRPRVPSSPERAAQHFHEYLIRAIRRRGGFESRAAALDFMADALQRAERRLDRERLVAKGEPRLDSGAQMAQPGL
jgi:hypothetical protein